MNAVAGLLIVAYVGAVFAAGNRAALGQAVLDDAPNFIPWLISVLLLLLVYQSRGYFGPASKTIGAIVVGGVLAVLLTSADSVKKAATDIGSLLKGQ